MNNSSHHHQESGDRCVICQQFFHRTRKNQKTCGDPECRRKRKRDQERAWIRRYREEKGQGYYEGSYDHVREWRKSHPDYQRRWRAKRRRALKDCSAEIHNAMLPAEPIKPILLRLRIPIALRLSEIQTLTLRLTRSQSGFLVDGSP